MTPHDLLLPTWTNMLRALSGMLDKAAAHNLGNALLDERLAEDMFPLATQIRFVCNLPGEGLVRLAGITFNSRDDDPDTLEEAKERVAATLTMLKAVEADSFLAEEDAFDMDLPNGMTFHLTGGAYARDWALPNFYFHVSTAYAIMRMHGVTLGKADLVPHMGRYIKQAD